MDNRKLRQNTIILDFDGTMCKLFEQYDLKQVSRLLRKKMALMNIDFSEDKDCFEVFNSIVQQTDESSDQRRTAFLVADKIISDAECEAVETGTDVDGIKDFIDLLLKYNMSVGIATNNSEDCVRKYFDIKGMIKNIPIVGRQALHPEYMKPNTWSVSTILDRLGSTSAEAIFIGDGLNDYICAKELSMSFIGMASTEKRGRD